MIVYIESNFIVELAAQQEEHSFCDELLQLAEDGAVQVVIPAFSLAEPIETLHRRRARRRDLQQELSREIRLLARSASFESSLREAVGVVSIMDESLRLEQERLDTVLERIASIATIVPLEAEILIGARALRDEFGLKHPDAVVLASVLTHVLKADAGETLFLQRDRKDFLNPDIQSRLRDAGCEMIGSFESGTGRIRASGE